MLSASGSGSVLGESFPFPSAFLSSQVLQGAAQATEHPQKALEFASGQGESSCLFS